MVNTRFNVAPVKGGGTCNQCLDGGEQEQRALADALPIPVIRYGCDGKRQYLNPAAEKMLRTESAQLLGRGPGEGGVLTHQSGIAFSAAIADVVATGATSIVEVTLDALPDATTIESYSVHFVAEKGPDGVTSVLAAFFDITARKQAEKSLQDRESFVSSLLNAIPIPVFYKGRDGRYLGVNRAYESFFGAQERDLVGKSVFDISPKELADIYYARDEALFESEGTQQYESQVMNTTGHLRDVVFNKAVFTDKQGNALGLIGAIQDITERKGAAEALQAQYEEILKLNERLEESARALEEYAVELEASQAQIKETEAWYRGVLHAAPDGVFVVNEDGIITFSNAQLSRMFGYSSGELIGQPLEILVAPDIRDSHAAMRKRIAEGAMEEGVSRLVSNLRACRRDGSEFFVDVTLSRLPESDSQSGVICAGVRDVTERRNSERKVQETVARLDGVLHTIPDLVWLKSADGRYLLCNHGFERLTGKREAELVGKTDYDLFNSELAEFFREKDLAAINAKQVCINEELVTFPDSGQAALLETRKVSVFDTNSEVTGVLGVARDITERKQMESALKWREQEFRTLAENSPDIIMRYDRDCRRTYVNPAFVNAIALPVESLLGSTPTQYSSSLHARAYEDAIRRVLSSGVACEHEYPWHTSEGRLIVSAFNIVPERDVDGEVKSVLAVGRDITARKRLEEALELREREFRTLVENSRDTVVRYGRDLRRIYVNPAFASLARGTKEALVGAMPSEYPGGKNGELYEKYLAEVFASGKGFEVEFKWPREDGGEIFTLTSFTPEFGADGTVESVLAFGRDITELHQSRQKIHQMAFYDPLTDLPNRSLFNDRLCQIVVDAAWHGQQAGIMLIDMDRFKEINDTMGHAVGDELLRQAAARLTGSVRSYDTVARLGGDEFAVLLPQIRAGDDLGRIASKILERFCEPFLLDGREVFVSCSIGIALYPEDSSEPNDLMKYADSAMYFAKRSGRNSFRFYSKDLTASANQRLALESELRRAIERGELDLHYQPKVSLRNGEVVGSEALLRWRSGIFGNVSPEQFIPIAEDTGQILVIGEWVLREACRCAVEWNAPGQPLHKVAINLSPRQFQSHDLVGVLSSVLEETGCRPEWIELEITESLLLDEEGDTQEILSSFKAMGISIAIDDFGTGYSALSYLARFPIDTLKIDRSFVSSVVTDKYRAELVKAILSIARCLGQQVVAEGVETVDQAAFLEANGCQVAQGFLYSKPLPKADWAQIPKSFIG